MSPMRRVLLLGACAVLAWSLLGNTSEARHWRSYGGRSCGWNDCGWSNCGWRTTSYGGGCCPQTACNTCFGQVSFTSSCCPGSGGTLEGQILHESPSYQEPQPAPGAPGEEPGEPPARIGAPPIPPAPNPAPGEGQGGLRAAPESPPTPALPPEREPSSPAPAGPEPGQGGAT